MTPRKAKPPAVPVEMPRTEGDFDTLSTAIEAHMQQGGRIGKLYKDKKIDAVEALNQAADADEKLYNINDALLSQREQEMQGAIDEEPVDAS